MTFQRNVVKLVSSSDGEPVAVHDFGGHGAPLLLGHGNGLNSGMWAPVLPLLVEHFSCYGVDLRGHGRAHAVSEGHSVDREHFAADVLAAVDAIGAPVRYAGHSLGGAAALYAAMARPSAFASLWLYEPVVVPTGFVREDHAGPELLIKASRRRRLDFDSIDDAVDRFSSKPPFFGCDSFAVRGYVEIGSYATEDGIRLSCTGENEARVFETVSELDFGRLADIAVPSLVVSGGSVDELNALPPRMAPLVSEALGNARWEQHRWLSHFGPMEAPRTIARSIIEHMA